MDDDDQSSCVLVAQVLKDLKNEGFEVDECKQNEGCVDCGVVVVVVVLMMIMIFMICVALRKADADLKAVRAQTDDDVSARCC